MSNIFDVAMETLQTLDGETVCCSGGANGGDAVWSQIAAKHDIETLHFSFEGHRKYSPDAEGLRIIVPTPEILRGDSALKRANKTLQRSYPTRNEHTNNLLRRNYYQILYSTSVYAVSRILEGVVDGGTSWATQMFIDRWMEHSPYDPAPIWVYDIFTDQWHQWVYNRWDPVDADQVPTPEGIWAGIGSRDLTDSAIKAMEALWQKTQITQVKQQQ